MEAGINVEGGIFWKKLVQKSNKRGKSVSLTSRLLEIEKSPSTAEKIHKMTTFFTQNHDLFQT